MRYRQFPQHRRVHHPDVPESQHQVGLGVPGVLLEGR